MGRGACSSQAECLSVRACAKVSHWLPPHTLLAACGGCAAVTLAGFSTCRGQCAARGSMEHTRHDRKRQPNHPELILLPDCLPIVEHRHDTFRVVIFQGCSRLAAPSLLGSAWLYGHEAAWPAG